MQFPIYKTRNISFLWKFTILSMVLFLSAGNFVFAQKPLEFKYFGAAGWQITDNGVVILIDPYVSRLLTNREEWTASKDEIVRTDSAQVRKLVPKADYIFVHHSHFDHLGDVPYIAKLTGAKVIGTETSINILKSYGISDEQLYPVKGGEDYLFDDLSVRVIPSIHSALSNKHYIDSRVYTSPPPLPLKGGDFIEGGSLMFLLRLSNKKVLTMGSMNFVEREIQGLNPDILLAGLNTSQKGLYNYYERLLKAVNLPEYVIATHWDSFMTPYGGSQEAKIKNLKEIEVEIKKVSPKSKFIIPVHLKAFEVR